MKGSVGECNNRALYLQDSKDVFSWLCAEVGDVRTVI